MTTIYDELSRKVVETDLAVIPAQYEYDGIGNLTVVIDALGQRIEYSYDLRVNNLITKTLYMEEIEIYPYDEVGNRVNKISFNGDLIRIRPKILLFMLMVNFITMSENQQNKQRMK